MIVIRFGEILEGRDEKNKKRLICDSLTRDTSYRFTSKKGDLFEITIFSLNSIEHDSRKSFIEIKHKLMTNPDHKINFVLDLKHLYDKEFHLNLTNDSKKVIQNCNLCKNYFNSFNHSSIIPDNQNIIIDVDFIWNKIKSQLETKNFFEDFFLDYSKNLLFDKK